MLVLVLQLYLAKQQTSKSFASSMVLDLYSHSVVLQKVLRLSKQQSVSTELLVSVQKPSPILQKILHNTPSVEMQSKNNWIITLDRESWTSSKVVLQLFLQKRRSLSVQMDLVSTHSLEQAPVRSIVLTLEVEIFPPSLVKRSTKKLRLQTTRLYRFNSLANLFPSLLSLLVLDLYSLHRVQQNLQLRIHQKIQFCLLFLVRQTPRQETSLVLDHCYHWICRRKNSTTSCWYWFLFAVGGAAEAVAFADADTLIARFSGGANESFIRSGYQATGSATLSGTSEEKHTERYVGDTAQYTISGGATEVRFVPLQWIWFAIHCEWSGRIQDHQQTRKYSSLHIQWRRQRKTRQQSSCWKRYYHSQR